VGALASRVAEQRAEGDPLSSAIRVYIAEFYRGRQRPEGNPGEERTARLLTR
jgi:hypothetical protein